MDYHVEEVLPLKDDPQPPDQADLPATALDETDPQGEEEVNPGSELPDDINNIYDEGIGANSLPAEGFSDQSDEEVDLATFLEQYGNQELDSENEPAPVPVEENDLPSNAGPGQGTILWENRDQQIDEEAEWNALSVNDELPQMGEDVDLDGLITEGAEQSQEGEPAYDHYSAGAYYPRHSEEINESSPFPEETSLSTGIELETNPVDPEESVPVVQEPVISVSPMPDVETGLERQKIALILSGGGARGAFQVGAEKYARDVKGYHWDIISGVSVGALNGAMLAMHRFTRLMEVWDSISDSQVYTGGFNLVSLVKLLFGAKSFYGNSPLQNLMQREFEAGRIIDDLHVGAVSLISGEYVQFTKDCLEISRAILASASIPVVWPPVDVSPERTSMVDGGVRNISPVGDVLDLEPDEIVIINCSAEQPPITPKAADNVLSIGMRAVDIMQNEIFLNDMKEFLRINALVKEAEQQGCLLHHPKSGKLLKYYPSQVIEPDGELGGILDFSQSSVQSALRAGVRRAREVLGRP